MQSVSNLLESLHQKDAIISELQQQLKNNELVHSDLKELLQTTVDDNMLEMAKLKMQSKHRLKLCKEKNFKTKLKYTTKLADNNIDYQSNIAQITMTSNSYYHKYHALLRMYLKQQEQQLRTQRYAQVTMATLNQKILPHMQLYQMRHKEDKENIDQLRDTISNLKRQLLTTRQNEDTLRIAVQSYKTAITNSVTEKFL